MVPDAPYWLDSTLSSTIEPLQDRETLLRFAEETGPEAARVIALTVAAEKAGFWMLARELVARWGQDQVVNDRLLDAVTSGAGSVLPLIQERMTHARELLKDPDTLVKRWAQEVVTALEDWRRRAEREDLEEWIWDHRIPRTELEAMLEKTDSPERLWAIARLLKDAPKERVLELLTPAEILDALPKLSRLDERTRQMWEAYARHWSGSN
jgi:hypothetical protein